ncbi:MAG: tripartite tricarboxylate transporter substrate binding protein [Rhodospirillaceae bacterium]|nr:tripartite tricarboxylate transporter substrate binding protein [Rhodospirillaceae bacterium]
MTLGSIRVESAARAAAALGCGLGLALAGAVPQALADWKPSRNVEFVVPAGTGGGADQMARMIQGVIQKHHLMDEAIVVVNKPGGSGGEGFLDMKASAGNPEKIIITLSSLFTTPLATGIPFNWDDLTPVAMLAEDEFILWVNGDTPYKTAQEYLDAAKAANGKFVMAGTGSKQEDQIITVGIEQATGVKLKYIAEKGGGDVAKAVVGKHADSSVNNPIEGVSFWKAGQMRPLCVFDSERIALTEKVTDSMSWHDIPTCKDSGVGLTYTMLRGIFTTPGATPEQVAFYVDLFKKVRETPEWKDFMLKGAYKQSFMTGDEFKAWLENAAKLHKDLMEKAGFIAS